MDPFVIGIVVVAAALVIGVYMWQHARTTQLQSQYGREYDRAVDELGRVRAQKALSERERRVERMQIRALTREQRDRFAARWDELQKQFVDDPDGAVREGDRLVEDVMDARGYPISNFDQRIADLSVHHVHVVDDYRALRDIAHKHIQQETSTEDLRQAMIHFRAVFDDLLEDRERVGERVIAREVHREVAAGGPAVVRSPDVVRRESDLR
jgi:hypothetical protein